jgi:hypothetical protein
LRPSRPRLVGIAFGENGDGPGFGHAQCVRKTGDPASYHQIIGVFDSTCRGVYLMRDGKVKSRPSIPERAARSKIKLKDTLFAYTPVGRKHLRENASRTGTLWAHRPGEH